MRALDRRQVLGSSIRDLIGGRWAISWIAYVLNAPLNVIAIGSNAGSSAAGASWGAWALVSVLGYLAFGLVFLIAHLTFFRNRALRPVAVLSVVRLGAVAGGARGLLVGALASAWGLASGDAGLIATRLLTGVVLGAVLVPLAAFILASIDAYRSQRSALLGELRRLQAVVLQDEGVTRELETTLLSSLRADLDEVVRTQDPDVARDVSRRIWEQSAPPATEPRMRWTSVLRASVQRNPFATWPVATIWSLSALGSLTAAIGVGRALAQIACSVIVIAAGFAIGRRLVARFPGASVTIFVITLVVLVVITGPVASVVFDARPWPAGASLVVVNSLWLPTLALAVGFVSAALRSGEDVLADLRAHVTDDELAALAAHDELERLRRGLATRLHGTVQSRLLATSAASPDPEEMARWIDELQSVSLDPADERTLAERLEAVAGPWCALVDVRLHLPDVETTDVDDAIVRLVEEAIANAYRHGRATAVSVTVAMDAGDVFVEITDQGQGLRPNHRPGMGSAVFDALAPGAWSLTAHAEGATLSARLR